MNDLRDYIDVAIALTAEGNLDEALDWLEASVKQDGLGAKEICRELLSRFAGEKKVVV